MITKIKVIIIFLLNLFNYSETNIKDFKILDYETEYVFAENYAEDEEFIISKGEKGYSYIENDQEVTKKPVKEVVKKGTRTNNDFSGTLTGYGPDCKGCSKIGTVACSTKDNKNWSLINDGIIYEDEDYGSVNIVASDHLLFPCGTIIEITNKNYEKLTAVVLDTGYTMRYKWRQNKEVHLDLAFASEKETSNVTSNETSYHVKRWGW